MAATVAIAVTVTVAVTSTPNGRQSYTGVTSLYATEICNIVFSIVVDAFDATGVRNGFDTRRFKMKTRRLKYLKGSWSDHHPIIS